MQTPPSWRERAGTALITLSSLQLLVALSLLAVTLTVSRDGSHEGAMSRWSDLHRDGLHELSLSVLLSAPALVPVIACGVGTKRILALTFALLSFAIMFSMAFGIVTL